MNELPLGGSLGESGGGAGAPRRRDRSRMIESQAFGRTGIAIVPRLLATLVSFTVIGLGLLAMVTQHFHGRAPAPGGTENAMEGMAAVVMGLSTVLAGMTPLALWFDQKRSALIWASACTAGAGVVFFIALRMM
jgi:hypothetical protein